MWKSLYACIHWAPQPCILISCCFLYGFILLQRGVLDEGRGPYLCVGIKTNIRTQLGIVLAVNGCRSFPYIYPLRLLSAASVHGVGLLTRTWTDSQNLHDQKEQTFPLRIVRHWWQLLSQMGVHMSPSLSHAWILSGLILCGPVRPVIGVLVIRVIVPKQFHCRADIHYLWRCFCSSSSSSLKLGRRSCGADVPLRAEHTASLILCMLPSCRSLC